MSPLGIIEKQRGGVAYAPEISRSQGVKLHHSGSEGKTFLSYSTVFWWRSGSSDFLPFVWCVEWVESKLQCHGHMTSILTCTVDCHLSISKHNANFIFFYANILFDCFDWWLNHKTKQMNVSTLCHYNEWAIFLCRLLRSLSHSLPFP